MTPHAVFRCFSLWFRQTRGPFLLLSVALVAVGTAAARSAGPVQHLHVVLLLAGVIAAHASVNLFNELSDYNSGIDSNTNRTPFSGGSGLLQAGLTSPAAVRMAAYGTMIVSGAVGFVFLLIRGWPLLLIMIPAALAVRFYTTHLARWVLGELAAGVTLGTLVVAGVYFSLRGTLSADIWALSVPPGLLTVLLLFLNEIPDADADKRGGRRHLVILLGKRRSAVVYAGVLAAVYLLILFNPVFFPIPRTTWVALLTMPMAVRACLITLVHYNDHQKLLPAQALNVGVVLFTDALLAAGYIIETSIHGMQ